MRIVTASDGSKKLVMTKKEWENLGQKNGWQTEAKKKEKSPKEHGFIDQCMKKNEDKKDPGAYCASIVDKVKGTTDWRKEPKKKD